ncbi:slipin family protein [Roseivirga sp.]|uniref:slipin family protein n=1 Tax=Roseivirga sp. TaxID=1964215 RepID=UPI003B8B9DEC
MKRIRINQGKVGLVFRNGDYQNVLTTGMHWVSLFDSIVEYDMSRAFKAPKALDILLKDERLVELLHIVDISDSEIVLKYENGNFKEVLVAGRYAFWKGLVNYAFIRADLREIEIDKSIDLSARKHVELIPYIRIYRVESYEKAILMANGGFYKQLDAGNYHFWNNEIALNMLKADMRQKQIEVSGQEILTKDKAALRINFYGQFKVKDIVKALVENKDYEKQLYVLMQIALREFVGKFTLDELLDEKDSLADYVKKVLKVKAKDLGIEIKDCGVKDIILPGEVKNIMNQVLVAQKQAQANVVARREETASTRNLLNTAKLMEDNEMLFKLKEMEYVEKIADKVSNISISGGHKVVDQMKEIFTGFK